MNFTLATSALLTLLCTGVAWGQRVSVPDSIDRFLEAELTRQRIPECRSRCFGATA